MPEATEREWLEGLRDEDERAWVEWCEEQDEDREMPPARDDDG